jgi:hypothetical protein
MTPKAVLAPFLGDLLSSAPAAGLEPGRVGAGAQGCVRPAEHGAVVSAGGAQRQARGSPRARTDRERRQGLWAPRNISPVAGHSRRPGRKYPIRG